MVCHVLRGEVSKDFVEVFHWLGLFYPHNFDISIIIGHNAVSLNAGLQSYTVG